MTSQRNHNQISHVAGATTQELRKLGSRCEVGAAEKGALKESKVGGQMRGGEGWAAAETRGLGAAKGKNSFTPDKCLLLSSAPAAASAVGWDPSPSCLEVQIAPGGMIVSL